MAIRLTDIKGTGSSYAELDDKMLVLDFQAGHPEAFVEIHRRYAPLARHVCRRFLPNAQDADEALQETMIRVFQGLFRFNGQFALQPWIARIATNVSLDQLRSRARRPQLDDDAIEAHDREDDTDTPDQLVERLLERDLVLAVLADLPDSHRRALVLRELEGRSHREIGDAMGISASQAKALIHRAKGSFRRAWLVRTTERGGLMGIALLPVLWALQALGVVRRVGEKAVHMGHVAQAATPEIVSTSAAVAAPASTGFAERAVAAGVTILIAGGVTVGAVSVTRSHAPEPRQHPRIAAAAPAVPQTKAQPSPVHVTPVSTPVDEPRDKPDKGQHEAPVVPVASPSPSAEPSPTQEPTPDPSPTDEPTPDPSSSESPPPIPPAPDWQFAFTTAATGVDHCDCSGAHIVSSLVDGTLPDVSFDQSLEGVALDSSGGAAWTVSLDVNGSANETMGDLSVSFVLGGRGVLNAYTGSAVLVAAEIDGSGPAVYRFSGSYEAQGTVEEGRPVKGAFTAVIGIWPDNTIYTESFALS